MLENVKVGKNPKECFAEMSKNRKMQNGLGSQMMQLDSPELQKSMEELRHRNCKTAFHKIMEHNGFKRTFEGIIFPFTCTPLDHSLTLEKTHSLQFLYSAVWDILLLCQPVERLATSSSSTLDLFFFGAILSVTSYALRLGGYERG